MDSKKDACNQSMLQDILRRITNTSLAEPNSSLPSLDIASVDFKCFILLPTRHPRFSSRCHLLFVFRLSLSSRLGSMTSIPRSYLITAILRSLPSSQRHRSALPYALRFKHLLSDNLSEDDWWVALVSPFSWVNLRLQFPFFAYCPRHSFIPSS